MLLKATVETLSEGDDADAGVMPRLVIPTKRPETRRSTVDTEILRRATEMERKGWAVKTGLLKVTSGAMIPRASHPPTWGVNTRSRGMAEGPKRYHLLTTPRVE
jgi:hypothetical protein